ncbi:MAG: Large extracellular alpha-helical protein [Elusimicrobia bacterium]|nr:MAG: Large extracellular alpha-helical protein [Elusimicrobiota bacterium]KAF0155238.1 MAG: Large extracellular alpha-helical protein [Elusimicrobiota bacterium]
MLRLAAILLFSFQPLHAQPAAGADALFDKGLYQEALELYSKKAGYGSEAAMRALYRSAECEALLFRYAEANARLYDLKLPADPVWKGRLLALRAELGKEFLRQYGYSLPADLQKGTTDLTKLTRKEWQARINSDYDALWPLAEKIAAAPLAEEGYFVDLEKAYLGYTPSLWDFYALKWAAWLIDGADKPSENPAAERFLSEKYKYDFSREMHPALKAAAVYERASGFAPSGSTPGEYWKVRRALIPYRLGYRLEKGNNEGHKSPKSKRGLAVKGEMGAVAELLAGWSVSFASPQGKTWAAREAAYIYNDMGEFKRAVELCSAAGDYAPGSKPAHECEQLKSRIEMPSLSLAVRTAPPPGRGGLSVTARNLSQVYFRAYRTSPAGLEFAGARSDRGWDRLRRLSLETAEFFLKKGHDVSWKTDIAYPAPYEHHTQEAGGPGLKKGLYVVVAAGDPAFDSGSSLMQAGVLNVTDIWLMAAGAPKGDPEDFLASPDGARRAAAPMFHLYALDGKDGSPLAGAKLDYFYSLPRRGDWHKSSASFGPDGSLELPFDLSVSYPSRESFSLDPLVAHGGAYAYTGGTLSSSLPVPQPLVVGVDTDRPVYRPGQEVGFKVTVLERRPRGYSVHARGRKIKVSARDANWQEFFSSSYELNDMGSAAGSFTIPSGRLLGNYQLNAELLGYGTSFRGTASFGVEEYKRPEFEVLLEEAKGPLRFGRKAKISGSARYYFGSPVPGAEIRYRVARSRYVPWYAWWMPRDASSGEVAAGNIKTSPDGGFSFEFTPEGEGDHPADFRVTAEARDAGGRVITAARSYRAGARSYIVDMQPAAGFFTPSDAPSVKVRLMNLSDAQVSGRGAYELYRLDKTPDFTPSPGWRGSFERNPDLNAFFAPAPDGRLMEKGAVEFDEKSARDLKLKPLTEGVYRLRLKAADPWGGESSGSLVLVSYAPGKKISSLNLPPVAIFERPSYQEGETARLLLGASALKGAKFLEIFAGSFLLEKRVLKAPGVSMTGIKIGPEHRGGFDARWFGVYDFAGYSASEHAEVPFSDRALSLTLDHQKSLLPGGRADWKLVARDGGGRPVDGEATVRVFDRSLEYYRGLGGSWLDGLYPDRRSRVHSLSSLFQSQATGFPVKRGLISRMFSIFERSAVEEVFPSFRLNSSRLGGGGLASGYGGKSLRYELEEGFADSAMQAAPAAAPGASIARAKSASAGSENKEDAAPREAVAPVRSDFSETAYFNPQLKIEKGRGAVSFKMPERLTSWKVTARVMTPDVRRGGISAEVVTRKDLMARLDLPRYLREGDESELVAVITNASDGPLGGTAVLSVTRDGADAAGELGLKDLTRSFSVKKDGSASMKWPVKAPLSTGLYKVRLVARAGRFSDAQENDLPLLPSRERLFASVNAALDGDVRKELRLKELEKKDASRVMESSHLEIQPQLALTVLNSLPYLVRYPHECTEQLLNRYVPLSIVNAVYSKHPALAAAAAKLPKRSALTPAWERDNPLRLISLLETPWEEASKGRASSLPAIDTLDPRLVEAERKAALEKLGSYQLADGSFPWFPGGRSNLHMTLYVLEGFAEGERYGVAAPAALARRALKYVLAEAPGYMKPEPAETSMLLYAAYVVSSLDKKWPEAGTALKYAKLWADYADGHYRAMTPMGKAYAAYIYLRLGEKEKADLYLKRAMDGSREDEVSGLYWAPEKISWLWYNDTVEKHAFLMRTLVAFRPEDPRAAKMAQWLLFNRRATEWKSTRASAAAIYSLLDFMKARGALDKGESFSLDWGGLKEKAAVGPADWLEKPLRWSLYGADAKPEHARAAITKKGPGLAFASLSAIYTGGGLAEASPSGMMNVGRKYFLREKEGDGYALKPLKSGDTVPAGSEIEVMLTVRTRSAFEYVHLKDPKPAGFEAESLLSGWKWDKVSRYEEQRDSLTNFFMEWVPRGEYEFGYRLRPSLPGTYRLGAATIQSMYAPEFGAHSDGMIIKVK